MKKIIFAIICIFSFSFCLNIHAKSFQFEWSNDVVEIPVGESIEKYKYTPKAKLLIDGVVCSDASITYSREGDWMYFMSDVNTSKIGEYQVWYKAYENKYKPGTCNGYKCLVKFIVKDNIAPTLSVVSDTVKLRRGSEYNVLDNVIATDNYTKDLKLSYTGIIDYNKLGSYSIRVCAADDSSNSSYVSFNVEIFEDTPPTITYKNEGLAINVSLNEDVNLYEYFTATDEIDGDITDLIEFPIIDTSSIGKKTYKAKVTNKVGITSEKNFIINVIDDEKPVITLSPANNTVQLSYDLNFDMFDFSKYIKSVTDNERVKISDVRITHDIVPKVGSYSVYYSYDDGTFETTEVLTVKLISYEKPVIETSNITIEPSAVVDLKELITVTDPSDDDIDSNVIIDDSNVDYETEGEYTVSVYVMNSSGQSSAKDIKLSITSGALASSNDGGISINYQLIFMIVLSILVLILIVFNSTQLIIQKKNKRI